MQAKAPRPLTSVDLSVSLRIPACTYSKQTTKEQTVPCITVLVRALSDLRHELQQKGSNLVVVTGPWAEVLPALAARVGAQAIMAEEEVEHG